MSRGTGWESGALGPDDYYDVIAPDQKHVREWCERTSLYRSTAAVKIKARSYSMEAANPRHEHEWMLW